MMICTPEIIIFGGTGQFNERQNNQCHDLKTSFELSGITGKYIDLSKIKLFHQRDDIDRSKKKMVKKKFELYYFLMSF